MERNGNISPKQAIRLADLRAWHEITAICSRCRHEQRLPAATLAWDWPEHTCLSDLERKLRCWHCGNREHNTLAVSQLPRN